MKNTQPIYIITLALNLCGCGLLSGVKVNGKPLGHSTANGPVSQSHASTFTGPTSSPESAKGKMAEARGEYGAYPEIFVEEGLAGPEYCVTELAPSSGTPVADQVRSIGCAKLVFVCKNRSGESEYCTDPYNNGKHIYPWFNAHHSHISMSDQGDALEMGLLIAAYARERDYFFQHALRPQHGDRDHRPTPTNPAVITGQLLDYASHLEPEAFRAALAKVEVPAQVRSAVAQLIPKGLAMLQEEANAIEPGLRELAIEVPARVRNERAKHRKAFARQFAQARKLIGQIQESIKNAKPDKGLLGRAAALRDDYLKACRKQLSLTKCIGGPLANPLTSAMIELAQATGDHNLGYAENFLLYRASPEATLAQAVSAEQERRAKELLERYNSDSERAARQAGGGSFAASPHDAFWSMPRRPIDYGYGFGSGEWNTWRARVKDIKRRGKSAIIEFFPDDGEKIVAYNCSKKSKFVGFDSNGNAEYDKVCNHKRVAAKYPVKPITLDTSETTAIHKGDIATFVRTKKGPIYFVYAMDRENQNAAVRGIRLSKNDLPNFWK